MSYFCYVIVLVALAAAFVVLVMKKWGITEWMQIHGDEYMSKLFGCDLCMSFWTAVILCLPLCMFFDSGLYMFMPVFSTPITRMLV